MNLKCIILVAAIGLQLATGAAAQTVFSTPYIGDRVIYVDTVADMLALPAGKSLNGQVVVTKRYSTSHTVGDGSGNAYRSDTSESGTPDGGFIIDDTGTHWHAVDKSVVRPEQFGCLGDGATDDTTALQAAIDATEGGKDMQCRAGATYLLSGYVRFISGSNFVVHGNGATWKTADGTAVTNNLQEVCQFQACSDFAVYDLTFDGNIDNRTHPHTQAAVHAVHLVHSVFRAKFDNCRFINGALDGLYAGNSSNDNFAQISTDVHFDGCRFVGNYRQGVSLSAAIRFSFSDCLFAETLGIRPMAGVDLEPNPLSTTTAWAGSTAYAVGDEREHPNNDTIKIRRVVAGTSEATWSDTESAAWEMLYQVEDTTFTGCVFENNQGYGIKSLESAGRTTISGGTIRNNKLGQVEAGSTVLLSGVNIEEWRDPPDWTTATAYAAGTLVRDPVGGKWAVAKQDFTSGATFAADGSDTNETLNGNEWYEVTPLGAITSLFGDITHTLTLSGCHVRNILAPSAASVSGGSKYAVWSNNAYVAIELSGTTFDNTCGGVQAPSTKKAIIAGCTFRDTDGIAANIGRGAVLSGNLFQRGSDRAINANNEAAQITGNVFEDIDDTTGVVRLFGDNCSVVGNTFALSSPASLRVCRYEGDNCIWRDNNYYNVTPTFLDNGGSLNCETVTASAPALSTMPGIETEIDSSSNAVNATLGSGEYVGQIKTIVMTDASNSSTVSVTNHTTSDPEVFTFDAVDEYLVLQWTGTEWVTIAGDATT